MKELEKLGARVAALQVVQEGDTDFKAQLKKIKAANPDALAILTYYTTGALVTLQARSLEIDDSPDRHRRARGGPVHRARWTGAMPRASTVNTEFSADDPAPEVRSFVAAYPGASST